MPKHLPTLVALVALLAFTGTGHAQSNPCNPCGGKAANPCNPCGGKAANPCNPCSGKDAQAPKVAVNPCHAKMGTVFHVDDPMNRNTATFTSEAPLEDMTGTTNTLSGYLAFNPNNPIMGIRGSIAVPVVSMKTGIPLRDEHMRSSDWLNAAEHPLITFEIEDTRNVRPVRREAGFATYNMTLIGPFTVNGVTRRVEIPARVTYLKESEKTRAKRPGNLMAVRADFNVPLSAHQIRGFEGVVGSRVSDEIEVEVSIFASDRPESSAANPCNPCNPCGGKR